VSDKKDEYYQPWLRDPDGIERPDAPKKDLKTDEGLAKPAEQPPIGIDVSRYPTEEKAPAARTPSPEKLKAGAKNFWHHVRQNSSAFAAWTIRIGERADIPARVEALEIPRRTGVVLRESARRTHQTAAAIGRATARGGRATGAASGQLWRRMALKDKVAKLAGGAGRGLGSVADRTRSGIVSAAKAGKDSLDEATSKLQPPPAEAPRSGLDQLLEREQAKADTRPSAPDLPLFARDKDIVPTIMPIPTAKSAPDIAAASPPAPPAQRAAIASRSPAPPAISGAASSPFASMTPTRWAAAIIGTLVLMAVSFWIGGRLGGGMNQTQVEKIVASYIQAHPEMIPEALEAHRANQVTQLINSMRPALEKPYAGAWAGNMNGDVNVVVFSDYACGFCRASVPDIDRLLREDKRVKVIYRELPIIAPQSRDAALMALAAARQGKYDAFHHAMFASSSLDKAAIQAAAVKVGVVTDGSADATGNQALLQREIDNNMAIAQQLQLNATPTWIIGDQLLQGQLGYDRLRDAVIEARKKS
jgi:protein-disulfide isomerase